MFASEHPHAGLLAIPTLHQMVLQVVNSVHAFIWHVLFSGILNQPLSEESLVRTSPGWLWQ